MAAHGTTQIKDREFDDALGTAQPLPNLYTQFTAVTNRNGGSLIGLGNAIVGLRVYCVPQTWHWGDTPGATTTTPLGADTTQWPKGDHPPTYPAAFRWGVVLYQTNTDGSVTYYQIVGTSEADTQEIRLEAGGADLYAAVNDGIGDYGDNSGTFQICVQINP